ncbi:hypothetical protein JW933_06655 [candidate division FCPU426 bacterium]|nr:hypothetical protein [candidate division FCPU426 bacterium]
MAGDVYIRKCEKCGEEVYGIMTFALAELLTILFECPTCGRIWSEDQRLQGVLDFTPAEGQEAD